MKLYNGRLNELGAELEEERRQGKLRGRRAVAQGEKIVASAKSEAEEDDRRHTQQTKETRIQGETDERRVRNALSRTMRQVEGHKARNLATEEAISRSLSEKEHHNATLKEMSVDLERLHSEHVSLTSELTEARLERASIRRSQEQKKISEDEAIIAGLWTTAQGLAAEEMREEGALAKASRNCRNEANERVRTISAYQERL